MALAERELPPSTPKPWGRRIGFGAALLAVILGWLLWRQGTPKGLVELPAGPLTPMLSLGRSHGVVLAPDGTLWSWGAEDLGWPVLGRGSTNGANFSPNLGRIGADQDWVQVSAGQDHNLAVKSDGSMWAYYGILNNGSRIDETGMNYRAVHYFRRWINMGSRILDFQYALIGINGGILITTVQPLIHLTSF